MKPLIILICLFLTPIANSQNDLLGLWYLNSIEVDNVIHPNLYNNESLFELEFFSSVGNENLTQFLGFAVCDAFGGNLTVSQNTITFAEFYFTQLGSCDPTPGFIFENEYFNIFNNQSAPFNVSYTISGTGNEETLVITNSTGDMAEYGRVPNTETLGRTWYLSRIEIPGNPSIEIPISDSPSLTITNTINPLTSKTTASGHGDCNSFFSDYSVTLNNGNSIQLQDFSPTLAFCDSNYENEYFSIIGNLSTNFSEFEILNDGATLFITDLLGARLVFDDEPLTILEQDSNRLQITLKNNPVSTEISLSLNPSENEIQYQIFTIDGKLIQERTRLNSTSINVENLETGLYLISFSNTFHQKTSLKFIKQ